MKKLFIDKDNLPYKISIEVEGKIFFLDFKRWTLSKEEIRVDLYDEEENLIVSDEKCILDIPLFIRFLRDKQGNFNPKYPKCFLTFYSLDENFYDVNYENLEEKVILTIQGADI